VPRGSEVLITVLSSGIQCLVVHWKSTVVLEEHVASILRFKCKQGKKRTWNREQAKPRKVELFLITLRTTNRLELVRSVWSLAIPSYGTYTIYKFYIPPTLSLLCSVWQYITVCFLFATSLPNPILLTDYLCYLITTLLLILCFAVYDGKINVYKIGRDVNKIWSTDSTRL
jgi:hypothetical protein